MTTSRHLWILALWLGAPAAAIPPPTPAEWEAMQRAKGLQGTVLVPIPSPFSYDAGSLHRLTLNGSWRRYIGFTGHTLIEWPASPARLNPGHPGQVQCRSGSCWLQGYIAPSLIGATPAGSMRSFFRYQLDCQDRTFDRLGDVRVPASLPKGWQPVENDPTALAVANSWCSRIDQLP